jgi:hypothetical protein
MTNTLYSSVGQNLPAYKTGAEPSGVHTKKTYGQMLTPLYACKLKVVDNFQHGTTDAAQERSLP